MEKYKVTKQNGNLIVECEGGEVIFTIPKEGSDVARITIEVNKGGKYTANDIYVMRKNMIREVLGVESSLEEIENTKKEESRKSI